MIPSARYLLAFTVNVLLPAAAYWVAFPYFGLSGALVASAVPVVAWMGIDLARFRHFDALSALVLAGIAMSLLLLAPGPATWLGAIRGPLVSGVIGALFLLSLLLPRPLVFYLARSTLSRERSGRELEFDAMWLAQPALVTSIRTMTAVWGVGLVAENIVRLWLAYRFSDDLTHRISTGISYAVYGGLTVWNILYRQHYIRKRLTQSSGS